MQGNHLYEYAIIRVVPRVEREEFINIGVILYCPSQGFLQTRYELNVPRISAFSPSLDLEDVTLYLDALERICKGRKEGGAIGSLPLSSRFRWLTATRSTVIQSSRVHSGFCKDPSETLMKLFDQQVR
ncbi:MAG: DUF3037 domain-containing protein [Dyadobacter sp.]|uniref:DUF3037 domain-containing protein n=1 Tax=Dyadobacter sp. TaxID=1914288 RepID=UPI003264BC6C